VAEEIGKIEKPGLDQFHAKRKLYVIPLLFAGTEAPPEYKEKYERFWQQVADQITAQESKVGKINRIYHESISLSGEDGINILERVNLLSHKIVKEKVAKGAVFEAVEEMELLDECMDWERCLLMGFYSSKVSDIITRSYREASAKRNEYISHCIDETLKDSEVALLFIREGHAVQFPVNVDVFIVAPPALDEIHRWLRDRQKEPPQEEKGEEK
jgi:hypothetical protein